MNNKIELNKIEPLCLEFSKQASDCFLLPFEWSYEECNNFSLHSLGDMIYNKPSFYKIENCAF